MSFLVLEQLRRAIRKCLDTSCDYLHKPELIGVDFAELVEQQLPLGIDNDRPPEDAGELIERRLSRTRLCRPVVADADLDLQRSGMFSVSWVSRYVVRGFTTRLTATLYVSS